MVRKKVKKLMPASRIGRTIAGVLLIIGGIFGFVPVLGFWMLPLGVVVLSVDFPSVRRFRRKCEIKIGRWWQARKKQKNAKNIS